MNCHPERSEGSSTKELNACLASTEDPSLSLKTTNVVLIIRSAVDFVNTNLMNLS